MYRITFSDGSSVLTDKPVYNRMQTNGSYGLATADTAQGIVLGGKVYSIAGREPLPGVTDVVTITEEDASAYFSATAERQTADIDYLSMMTGVDLPGGEML